LSDAERPQELVLVLPSSEQPHRERELGQALPLPEPGLQALPAPVQEQLVLEPRSEP
jgi:hypothetical protein